jgi:hypothetical protein
MENAWLSFNMLAREPLPFCRRRLVHKETHVDVYATGKAFLQGSGGGLLVR